MMLMRLVAVGMVALLASSTVALAADPAAGTSAARVPSAEASAQPNVTPEQLPVSLDRIRREIAQQPRTSDFALRLEYYIEVYGKAQSIPLFPEDANLVNGPVPYGGPTHAEVVQLVTPQEFRTPAADLTSVVSALTNWLSHRRSSSSGADR